MYERFYIFTAHKRSLGQGNVFTGVCLSTGGVSWITGHMTGGSVQRGLCPGGSLSRRALCLGGSLSGRPHGNKRVVRILLECILVDFRFLFLYFFYFTNWLRPGKAMEIPWWCEETLSSRHVQREFFNFAISTRESRPFHCETSGWTSLPSKLLDNPLCLFHRGNPLKFGANHLNWFRVSPNKWENVANSMWQKGNRSRWIFLK